MANTKHHQILIVGGGTAGVTVAASLRRRGPGSLDIAIVEPSEIHYYQPCFTLVGAGTYDMAKTRRPERSLIPAGVTFIHGPPKRLTLTRTASCSKPVTRLLMTTLSFVPA